MDNGFPKNKANLDKNSDLVPRLEESNRGISLHHVALRILANVNNIKLSLASS